VTRAQAQEIARGSVKFVQALFSAESISGRRNTEAIEVGPNTLMAGRVIEHKPAAPRPFDQVKDEITRQLARNAASEMAQKAGREKLALLEQGKSEKEAGITFSTPLTLLRNQLQPGVTPEALTRIFQVDAAKGSAVRRRVRDRGGFAIYKIVKVIAPPPAVRPSSRLRPTRSASCRIARFSTRM
jgi:peptidyl-prolyl cis-trans isomerase D